MVPYVKTLGSEISQKLAAMGYECQPGPDNLMGNTVVYRVGENLGFEVSVPGSNPNNGCLFGPAEDYPETQKTLFKDLFNAAKSINPETHNKWDYAVVPGPEYENAGIKSSTYLIYATDAEGY